MSFILKSSLILFFVIFAPLSIHAQPAGLDDTSCSNTKAASNKFETPTKISTASKKYAGQCIDSDHFRPAVITSKNKHSITFQNYLHENKFWKASLSRTAVVEDVFVQVVRFSIISGVTAAHVQFRATFAKGSEIKLKSAEGDLIVNDVVFSFEAARPKDVSYNFALGAVDNYLLVGRVASGAQRLSEYSDENKTEQYQLNLPPEEKLELVLKALQLSHDSKFNRFYNTLKPNCTTEIFDLIDQLPSQSKNNNQAFLTVISNDPVAGPTIDALKERHVGSASLFKGRYANLREELETGASAPPKEEPKKESLNLLPEIEDYPYSLVLLNSEDDQNSKILKKAKKLAYKTAPKIIQHLGSSLMLSGSDPSENLLSSLNGLGPFLQEQLKSLNSELSDSPLTIALYLTPWDQREGLQIDITKELGVQARLPFKTYESVFDFPSMNSISIGFSEAAAVHANNKTSFGLMGIVIQLNLIKDGSSISLQAIGQNGELQKELSVSNDQVNIKKPAYAHDWPYGFLAIIS